MNLPNIILKQFVENILMFLFFLVLLPRVGVDFIAQGWRRSYGAAWVAGGSTLRGRPGRRSRNSGVGLPDASVSVPSRR